MAKDKEEEEKQTAPKKKLAAFLPGLGSLKRPSLKDLASVKQAVGGTVSGMTSRVAGMGSRVSDWKQHIPRYRIAIRYKFIAAFVFMTGITILVMGYVVLNQQEEQLYQQTVQTGKVSLNSLLNNAKLPLVEDDILALNTSIKQVRAIEGMLYGIIVGKSGKIKAHTDSKKINTDYVRVENIKNETTEGKVSYYNFVDGDGNQVLNLSQTVKFGKSVLGNIHVGISLDFIDDQVSEARNFILLLGLGIIVVGILFGIFMGVGMSRPIYQLVTATNEIGKGNFEYRINKIRNDELGDLATAVNTMSDELMKKELMQGAFGKYVGSEILDMILDDPDSAMLKGTRATATVLFTDIRGFTAYSENLEPEVVVEALNEYFSIATAAIQNRGGYVDKFIGDAVLGVFGVPVPTEDHAEMGVRCCLEMQEEFAKKAKDLDNNVLGKVGIGLNTGDLVSGNIGSSDKMEYSVIGDAVNVASRINGLAMSGETVISESTYQAMKDKIKVEPLELQSVKGKSEKIQSYRLLEID